MSTRVIGALGLALLFASSAACATDLYSRDGWPALASDRVAHKVGDTLTVVVYESAVAVDSANSGSNRATNLSGQLSGGAANSSAHAFGGSGALNLSNDANNSATTGRSGGMVAQISVTVDQLLPNGDLHVSGAQALNINGNTTNIRIKGRVRPADISASNAITSNRLADAAIDYDGEGFVSRGASEGIITRIFNWLGLP